MRTVLWTTAIVLAIVFSSLGVNRYLGQTSLELCQQIEQIQASVSAGQWDAAESRFQRVDSRWEEVRSIWAAIIRHQEIDELEKAFVRIEQFIISQDKGLALAELETAKLLLEHVPEKEKIRLHNIM